MLTSLFYLLYPPLHWECSFPSCSISEQRWVLYVALMCWLADLLCSISERSHRMSQLPGVGHHTTTSKQLYEHMAEWLRHWTRDNRVWGSFLQRRSCVKALSKLWIHTTSAHLTVMGTRWNENCYSVNGYSCRKLRCIHPREIKLWKSEFQYLRVHNVCPLNLFGISGL